MAHTPYGYIIIDGKAQINEERAKQIISLFEAYNSGASLRAAAETVGLSRTHSSIGKILRNERYLGTDFYPSIVSDVLFNEVQEERLKRAKALGRIFDFQVNDNKKKNKHFHSLKKVEHIYDNPFRQAEYAYGLIESEVLNE